MTKGTYQTFRRLLTVYARPYTPRLVLGIVAGLVVGGSLFGMLRFSPALIKPFEEGLAGSTQAAEGNVAPKAADTVETRTEKEEAEAKTSRRIALLQRLSKRLGIPLVDDSGGTTWQFMVVAVSGMLFFVLIKGGATFLNRYCLRWVGSRVVVDLRRDLFGSLQNQSLAFFGKADVGELISRCTYDTSLIETAIAGTVADMARAPVEIIATVSFVVLAAIEHKLLGFVVALLLVFPLLVFPILFLGRYVRRYARRALGRVGDLVSRMQENFTGIRVVKAYNMEAHELARFTGMNESYFRSMIRALRAELCMNPLMECVGVISACVFLIFCHLRGVRLHQILPMGAAAVLAYRPLKQLAKVNVGVQRSVAAAERLFALLDVDTRLPEAEDAVRVDTFADRVSFENVTFAYDPGSPKVLHDVSFEVRKGDVVAFVGETGSGKTTVANLLARFYDPSVGHIRLDGHDLRDMEIASLRKLIGMVTQETILFNETVADNIRYGNPGASLEEVEAAARKANAHEFIMAEPTGYDRVVGEKGFLLSGGQRQRVAIARAILRNPPILILDEATSALDTATEQLVQEAINRVMTDRTVFAIAHRLSTIKHANLICVLDKGQIVERGTHDELYEAGGLYRKLCDMQFA
ncbi:MAG: ABC transporter ATP-binding protein [Lentisphaerae bacterium]|jgi:ATP-binding cassette, subfamily B, bacterial MsbA|nr:ABC transporter ATP-binding protein [Lentisphaerota bacterium]MBT4816425.1 ABC transporter ATP-binding protein [Lentisphaerota bacterium]MBT5604583.1 ABC transporter ATP-binding protein [Lentisphaerota bacterium]MBT7061756.1 ABC transporter ATP-binding protein [Lentisphaerota bacterium]MBT7848786.1 ABC transporter ATP-binding protein [Lentisphaerota bacterium]